MQSDKSPSEQERRSLYFTRACAALLDLARYTDLDLLSIENCYSDNETANTLAALLPNAVIRSVSGDVSEPDRPTEVERVLSEYDIVLVSRYHSAILGMRTNTPVLVLDPFGGIDAEPTKLAHLMQTANLGKRYWAPVPYAGAPKCAAQDIVQATFEALNEDTPEADVYADRHRAVQLSFDSLAGFLEHI